MAPRSIEKTTLIERFVGLIPIPYPLAALVWTVLLGFPGFSAIQLLATGSTTFSLANLPNSLLNISLTYYLFLMVRYMRLRVVAAEPLVAGRLSGGEQDYHRACGRMTQTAPVIGLAAATGTVLLASYAYLGILAAIPGLIAFNVILVYLNSLAYSTYLWEFATASLGLYRLGGSSLKLDSFLADRMMGSKPMGNLALVLTVAYFGALLLAFLLFSTFLPSTVPGTVAFYTSLLLGVALFFLPLTSIHTKMRAEKGRLLREIGARYAQLNQDPSRPGETATLDDVRVGLARLAALQELEMMDRKVASLPTWPFDIQVVSKFITIVLSVTAVLSARLLTNFLHI